MDKIRAFIALSLPSVVTSILTARADSLAQRVSPGTVRWVKPEAMHLTLRFLGDTPLDRLPTIREGLDQVAGQTAPFDLWLGELGAFPNQRRPRVIWVGVTDPNRQSVQLKRAIDAMLAPLGWEAEPRPFQPHLTLGRVKDLREQLAFPWREPLEPVSWRVTAVHLIESQLRPTGSLYTLRHSSPLGAESGG